MVKEHSVDSLDGGRYNIQWKSEFILLIFIIIFGLIGLAFCLALNDSSNNDLSLVKAEETIHQTFV